MLDEHEPYATNARDLSGRGHWQPGITDCPLARKRLSTVMKTKIKQSYHAYHASPPLALWSSWPALFLLRVNICPQDCRRGQKLRGAAKAGPSRRARLGLLVPPLLSLWLCSEGLIPLLYWQWLQANPSFSSGRPHGRFGVIISASLTDLLH